MKKYWRVLIVIIGTMGILSLVLNEAFITNPTNPMQSLSIFKYFTVQSNLVAVLYFCLLIFLKVDKRSEKWKNLIGGVMIYTTITFLIFAIVLEGLWDEKGLAQVGSILLHYINPIMIIGYVIYFRKEYHFIFKDSITWVIYPVIYLVFLVTWGMITSDFLYPFLQVSVIGIFGLIASIVGLVGLFFALSFIVVKILSKK